MEHLGHQNRKKIVYDSDMVVYRGIMGDFWGVMGAKGEAKEGQATNLHLPETARRPQVDRRETAGRSRGGSKETSSIPRKKFCTANHPLEEDF